MKRLEVEEIMDWFAQHRFPNIICTCMEDTVSMFIERVEELEKVGKEMLEFIAGEDSAVPMFRTFEWMKVLEGKK